MRREIYVCDADELPPGGRRIIEVGGREIGVFNVNGSFYALRNVCPHQGAPLCRGETGGTFAPSAPGTFDFIRDGEIIRCPWHAWEFDLLTGISIVDPTCRVRAFQVVVREASVFLVT